MAPVQILMNQIFMKTEINMIIKRIAMLMISLLSWEIHVNAQINSQNDSIYSLAVNYYKGQNGVFMDREKGIALIQEAASLGHPKAIFNCGELYHEGIYFEKSDSIALSYFIRAAELGELNAMTRCGLCYANGIGTMQDKDKSFQYYLSAAELGDDCGAYNVALFYRNEDIVGDNPSEQYKWLRFAAEKNNIGAQYLLAVDYFRGLRSVSKQDFDQSFFWANLAAQNGSAEGMNLCAILLQNTKPKDALEFAKKAYEMGEYNGRRNYADFLKDGIGCEKNILDAFHLYAEGVDDGDPYCMFRLGELVINDENINLTLHGKSLSRKKSVETAYDLIKSAAEQNCEEAIQYCKENSI